ncbi:MAG: glycosyltransferase [Ignavibacteriae bacterium]|nr:glycosyltransferase [Ignavibacteriota bacterium]
MNIVFLSYFYDKDVENETSLLTRYNSTTEWCKAVLKAGANSVSVVQRFHKNSHLIHEGIHYYFVSDGLGNLTTPLDSFQNIHDVVVQLKPDVVHHNGWAYPLIHLRPRLSKETAIVWQHHGGGMPQWYSRPFYQTGFDVVDSFLFTSLEISHSWKKKKIISKHKEVHEVIESSSSFHPQGKQLSRTQLGLRGEEIFLWVGRLDANKDPLTVIKGFHKALLHLRDAHLYMIFHEGNLLNEVRQIIAALGLTERIHLLGKQPHELLEQYYSAADYFLLGSHHEGSGFALLESLACGVVPIVTDIPSFRKITNNGEIGKLWSVGVVESCAQAIVEASKKKRTREDVLDFFDRVLSYLALGKQALNAYQATYEKRNSVKKKVAVFVPGGIDSPQSGLQVPALVQLLSGLSEHYDMTIFSLIRVSENNISKCGNADIVFLNAQPSDSFIKKLYLLIKAFIKQHEQFDLIHGLWGTPTGLVAVIIGKLFGVPSIVSFLGGETANLLEISYGNMRSLFLRSVMLWLTKNADALVLLTNYQHQQINQLRMDPKEVHIIPLGVDTEQFAVHEKRELVPPFHFLHVGTLNKVKDHETLLRAFKLISGKVDCELKLVGADYLNGAVQQMIHQLRLDEKVTYFGVVEYEKMIDYYRWADVLLHTSRHEAQGMIIVEAAACNVVVCGTNVGLLSDFSPEKAVAVNVGDYQSLANEVLKLLNDKGRIEKLRNSAHDWATEHDIRWSVNQVKALYDKFLYIEHEQK